MLLNIVLYLIYTVLVLICRNIFVSIIKKSIMKNIWVLLVLPFVLFCVISCSTENRDIEVKSSDIELNVYLLKNKDDIKVKVSSFTDEGSFDFEVKDNLYNQKYKAVKGYTFVANSLDSSVLMTLEVIDSKTKRIMKKESGYVRVQISSR